jgi:hypothetical protein
VVFGAIPNSQLARSCGNRSIETPAARAGELSHIRLHFVIDDAEFGSARDGNPNAETNFELFSLSRRPYCAIQRNIGERGIPFAESKKRTP